MTTKPPMLAADHIRDLVKGFTTYELVKQPTQGKDGKWRPEARIHAVTHPPLLDQLEAVVTGASCLSDDDAARGSFASKPAARLEVIDTLAHIDTDSLYYAVDLGLQDPPRTKTQVPVAQPMRDRLLAISGKVGDTEDARVKRWWTWARLATQWDQRPFQPASVPCLNCWAVKSLRIDVVHELARCTECHTAWSGPGEIGLLARHVAFCTDHEVTKPRHWLLDDLGHPIECTKCLSFRDEYAEAKTMQAMARDARPSTVA